jgi:hypothetical protein
MEASKGAAVAGERKAVASRRFGLREGCGEPGSIDPEAGETGRGGAKRRIVRRSQIKREGDSISGASYFIIRVIYNFDFEVRCLSI